MSQLRNRCLTLLAVIALAAPVTSLAEDPAPAPSSAEASPTESPMAGFERLIGGEWQISILRHRFEWGIGRHTVLARSYDKDGHLASEARWFWHPGERSIKGYAIDAEGKSLTEMTTRFEGETMVNVLEVVNPDETTATYTGRWVFTDRDHYDWTLFGHGPDGEKTQMMQATANRQARSDP